MHYTLSMHDLLFPFQANYFISMPFISSLYEQSSLFQSWPQPFWWHVQNYGTWNNVELWTLMWTGIILRDLHSPDYQVNYTLPVTAFFCRLISLFSVKQKCLKVGSLLPVINFLVMPESVLSIIVNVFSVHLFIYNNGYLLPCLSISMSMQNSL